MRLLLDTDAFCKLGVSGLLLDAVRLLGSDLPACGRLSALPYMLRKGRLRKRYGPDACDHLLSLALKIPDLVQATDTWLARLTTVEAIDSGEAQLFAAAAEQGLVVMTGDKRALRALKDVDGFPNALARRVVVLEAVLIVLCDRLGPDEVRHRVTPLITVDGMISTCFSTRCSDPRGGLLVYYDRLAGEVLPMTLWDPRTGSMT